MENNSSFISVKERLPEINQLVWLYDSKKKEIHLGMRVIPDYYFREFLNVDWAWAVAFRQPELIDGKITAECHKDDWYNFDYWCEVPNIPEI